MNASRLHSYPLLENVHVMASYDYRINVDCSLTVMARRLEERSLDELTFRITQDFSSETFNEAGDPVEHKPCDKRGVIAANRTKSALPLHYRQIVILFFRRLKIVIFGRNYFVPKRSF